MRARICHALVVPAALLGIVPALATAQLRIALGAEQSAQRNPAESPYVYSGWGPAVAMEYGRRSKGSESELLIALGYGSLTSDVPGARAQQGSFAIGSRYLRALDGPPATAAWKVGARLSASGTITNHQYASRDAFDDQFGYLNLGLGPSMVAAFRWRGAKITSDLSVPVANLIDMPYANAKMNGSLDLRLASLPTLQAFDETITLRPGLDRAGRIAWKYRLSFFRYSNAGTRTFARQSLSVSVDLRPGDTP